MNTLQFYYTLNVLGVSSVLRPKNIRNCYRLHPTFAQKADFLFFCDPIKSKEDKVLIQKIAGAIGSSRRLILEILNPQNPHTAFILNNFLIRFQPKGFVVFGMDLARRLIKNPLPAPNTEGFNTADSFLLKREIRISKNKTFTVPACVLDKVSAFTGPDLPNLRKKKQSAWNTLQQISRGIM